MEPSVQSPPSRKMRWISYIMSAVPVLFLVMGGVMKLIKPPFVLEGFKHLGIPESLVIGLGLLELVCAMIYVVPRTAVVGAILLTGYMGGAIFTHLRVGEPVYLQFLFGVVLWGGLYLRDLRLRGLIPLRS